MWVMDLVNSSLKRWICKASAVCTVFASVGLHFILKFLLWDLPGGPVVKNLPANAGDTGSIPDPARFHRPRCATGQLSPFATTTKAHEL